MSSNHCTLGNETRKLKIPIKAKNLTWISRSLQIKPEGNDAVAVMEWA